VSQSFSLFSVILYFPSHSFPFSVIPFLSQSFPFLSQSFLSFLSHFPSFLSHSFPFSVIPSFLSYFRSFLCHSFFLRHSPARPHLSAPSSFFPSAQLPPRSPASSLFPRARAPVWLRRPTSSGPTPLGTLTLTPASPEDPSTATPFFFRSGHLGSTVVQPPRRASDRQIPRKSSAAPPRSFPSPVFVFRARHHRDFAKKPPPVSCSAAPISSSPAGSGLP
jgi:hypothetical protein